VKFVDGLFGVRKHFSDGGQVACGHVAGERIDALRVATVPLQFFAHVFDRRFVATRFDIEDTAPYCVDGDGDVFVPTPKECLIHGDGADIGKIHTIYRVMHPIRKDSGKRLFVTAKQTRGSGTGNVLQESMA